MLIASTNSTKTMMILMALVIAVFVIVGVFIGYNVSQQTQDAEAHDIDSVISAKLLQTLKIQKTQYLINLT